MKAGTPRYWVLRKRHQGARTVIVRVFYLFVARSEFATEYLLNTKVNHEISRLGADSHKDMVALLFVATRIHEFGSF